jgi:polyhydroxyalkanoate synthesis repressor PhaR
MATTTTTRTRGARRPRSGGETAAESGRKGPRVIRKYPNRRLYDTVESRYVTLVDIRRLVVERIDFVVLDRKTQQDITRSILLQVIAEQEGGGESLMSRDFLSQVIRSYGNGLQDFVRRYLDESIQQFAREQRELRERFKNVVGIDPLETVTNVAQKNYQRWKSLQEEVFSRITRPFGREDRDKGIDRRTRPCRSTSSTFTRTTSPSLSLSLTRSTRSLEICEMCTRPSLPGRMLTNAPKSIRRTTRPS